MENLYGSICLTDIPKELITVGKNGKKYLNVVINARREVSQYGYTHYIKAYCKNRRFEAEPNAAPAGAGRHGVRATSQRSVR